MHAVVTENTSPVYEGSVCRECIINIIDGSFFALPRSPTSNEADFLCLAVHLFTDTQHCLNLTSYCEGVGSTFDSTIYSSSLEVCGIPERVCFSNITQAMNNTRLNFFMSTTSSCPVLPVGSVESRLYIASYNLITKGTD